MNMIEKIAVRGGVKHVAALFRRAIKGEKTMPHFYVMGKKVERPLRVPLSRRKELGKALKATKREAKKAVRGREPELAGAAAGLAAAVPAAYALSKMKKKETK